MAIVMPTSAELTTIAQDLLPVLQRDSPLFDIMPIRNVDAAMLMWDQLDNFQGLQQIRGLGGAPQRVTKLGYKRFTAAPGVYGEYERFDETELTEFRQRGSYDAPIDLTDLTTMANERLLTREIQRIEAVGWAALQGAIAVFNGTQLMYSDQFSVQSYTSTVSWGTALTATPLFDLRQVQLLARGHSVQFNATSTAFMNQYTFNRLVSNTNSADIYGRRVAGLATANGLKGINSILTEDDLPNFAIYDRGYLSDGSDGFASGTFELFIPNNTVIVIGKRPGNVMIAEYQMTRNANNPGFAPGPYTDVVDSITNRGVYPKTIDVHRGHSGGVAVLYSSAIAVMHV